MIIVVTVVSVIQVCLGEEHYPTVRPAALVNNAWLCALADALRMGVLLAALGPAAQITVKAPPYTMVARPNAIPAARAVQ